MNRAERGLMATREKSGKSNKGSADGNLARYAAAEGTVIGGVLGDEMHTPGIENPGQGLRHGFAVVGRRDHLADLGVVWRSFVWAASRLMWIIKWPPSGETA